METPAVVTKVWNGVTKFIAKELSQGKSVLVPPLGAFHVLRLLPDSHASVQTMLVFVPAAKLIRSAKLKTKDFVLDNFTVAPSISIHPALVANESAVPIDTTKSVLGSLLSTAYRCLVERRRVIIRFPKVGRLQSTGAYIDFRCEGNFVSPDDLSRYSKRLPHNVFTYLHKTGLQESIGSIEMFDSTGARARHHTPDAGRTNTRRHSKTNKNRSNGLMEDSPPALRPTTALHQGQVILSEGIRGTQSNVIERPNTSAAARQPVPTRQTELVSPSADLDSSILSMIRTHNSNLHAGHPIVPFPFTEGQLAELRNLKQQHRGHVFSTVTREDMNMYRTYQQNKNELDKSRQKMDDEFQLRLDMQKFKVELEAEQTRKQQEFERSKKMAEEQRLAFLEKRRKEKEEDALNRENNYFPFVEGMSLEEKRAREKALRAKQLSDHLSTQRSSFKWTGRSSPIEQLVSRFASEPTRIGRVSVPAMDNRHFKPEPAVEAAMREAEQRYAEKLKSLITKERTEAERAQELSRMLGYQYLREQQEKKKRQDMLKIALAQQVDDINKRKSIGNHAERHVDAITNSSLPIYERKSEDIIKHEKDMLKSSYDRQLMEKLMTQQQKLADEYERERSKVEVVQNEVRQSLAERKQQSQSTREDLSRTWKSQNNFSVQNRVNALTDVKI
eukprot:GILJ01006285.1.p1 GENE.GILJ01006285.1~~GILJ01006285.1.p1  ORF type:complete len:713 (+),score=104.36 GILJ01006285.1:122-2140(+)